jgi:hypothetical protein
MIWGVWLLKNCIFYIVHVVKPNKQIQIQNGFCQNKRPFEFIQDREEYFGGVTEPYWLSSEGVGLWLMGKDSTQGQPLFFSWNHQNKKVIYET